MRKGTLYQTMLEIFGGTKVKPVPTQVEGLRMVWKGEADAYFGPDRETYYALWKNDIPDIVSIGHPVDRTALYFAVYKGDEDVLSALNAGMREIRLSGTCNGIETVSVGFAEYYSETEQTFRLPYGSTNWSVTYLVDTTRLHEESYKLTLSASPYASYRRLLREVSVKLDLTPPEFCVIWPFCNGVQVSNTTTLYGYVVDNNAVDRVMVRVGTNAWQQATGTLDWSLSLNTTVLSNGPVTLHFAFFDIAGNSNHAAIGVVVTNQ